MNAGIQRYTKMVIEGKGWQSGSTLENRFVAHLSRLSVRPGQLLQQHQVGAFRLDFADPDVLMGIEADGFYHQMPGAAERDRSRDAWLLEQGWYLFRIPDEQDDYALQLRLHAVILLIREERVYRNLPWLREPRTTYRNPRPKPSRLAMAAGHTPAVGDE